MRSSLVRRITFILLLMLAVSGLSAEDPAPPADLKEDPVSLFSWKLGDTEVDFLLRGSWRVTLSAATGIRFGPGSETIFPFGFPAFGNGFFFEQLPALTFSLLFADRWFLEVAVVARFEDNTILAGYRGMPGEFVQSVLVGNKDTTIGDYDFVSVPAQSRSSLGASARFATSFSSHELLLRYDSTREEKKVFLGKSEVYEKYLTPADFLSGRYFMLPDPNVENLAVYLEDKNGAYTGSDGKHYRPAATTEIFQDTVNGFLYILLEHEGRVAVHYTLGAATVGDPGLGIDALPGTSGGYIDLTAPAEDFDFGAAYPLDNLAARELTINFQTCLLLWEPGSFSPFSMLSAYDLETAAPADISKVRINVIPKGAPESSYPLTPPVSFGVEPGRDFFIAYQNSNARSDFRNHYPFPDPDHQLYGPLRDHLPPFFEYEIFLETPTGYETYTLESNVVPGSIRVKRNGVDETRFNYDVNSYTLTFTTPIYPYDRIEVYYRVNVAEKNAGDILFAWGNKFPFSPMASLELAMGLRWNILPGAYTEKAYAKTGAVLFSGALKGSSENFSYKVSGAVSFSNPDTTGIMRLAGMEGKGILIEPGENLSSPSAAPSGIAGLADRGRLLYKDYREYDLLGGAVLKPYDWTGFQDWSYTTGSKVGPYLVAGSSASSHGQSLVMDFQLDADRDWVGIQIPFAYRNGTADLSNIRSLVASLRAVDVTGGFDVYLQIGAAAEDVDGDGILDEETSALSSGYSFDDTANFASLKVGGGPKNEGNGVINSEDIDGNGSLDAEEPGFVFTDPMPANFTADTGWGTKTVSLDTVSQEMLKRVRALRIVVVRNDPAPGTISARLLLDKILLSGASFWSGIDSGSYTDFNVREVTESYSGAPPLAASYSEVKDVFHSDGSTQEVLDIDWTGGAGTPGWTVKTALGSGTEGIRYRKLVFYAYKTASFGVGSTITIALDDYSGKGVTCIFDSDALDNDVDVWQKISLDLASGRLYINGSLVTGAVVTIDPGYGSLVFFSLSAANTSVDGRLLIDEIHLRDPESRIGAAAAASVSVSLPGPLLSLGSVPVLSNFTFAEDLSVRSGGFQTLYSRPQDETSIRSASVLGADVFFVKLGVNFQADGVGDDWSFSGGHDLKVPSIPSPVVFTDRYALQSRARGLEFNRENTLTLDLPGIIRTALAQSAYSRDLLLKQNWTGSLLVSGLAPYELSYTTAFSQSTDGFSAADRFYLLSWLSGYEYIVPWTGGSPLDRNYAATFSQRLSTQPVGAALSITSGYGSFEITGSSHRQRDTLTTRLALPVRIGTVSIEPSYTRTLTTQDTINSTGSLEADLASHFGTLGLHDYYWYMIPFREIFTDDYIPEFVGKASSSEKTNYKPELGLALIRPFGSSLTDLLLPSKITFAYGKEYVIQETLFNLFETLSISVLFNAINLFGARGAYPLIGLYDVDSFQTSFKSAFTWRETKELESANFSIESAYSFEGRKGDKLTLKNLFSVENTTLLRVFDQGTIEFLWQVFPENGVSLPLIGEETAKKGFIAHKESIEFRFYNFLETESTHPVNLVFKHETSIQYPEFGYLRGEIALGVDWESLPEQNVRQDIMIVGLRLTVELNVTF